MLRSGRSPLRRAAGSLAAPCALAALTLAACGKSGAPPKSAGAPASAQSSQKDAPAAQLVTMVTPSRLLPDLHNERGVLAYENGQRRVLLDRMRLVVRDDGTIERAAELLPIGNVNAVALPGRLGGGFVFHATSGGGTQLWRASSWLGKLRPLVQFSATTSEVVPGFDRLYLRLSSNNKVLAIDPETGEARPLGPLPPAAAYGGLSFADGWRAVVETDLRGPLATFDAGATWRSLGVAERPTAIGLSDGDPALFVGRGRYVLDARGNLTFRGEPEHIDEDDEKYEPTGRPPGPFGKRPLRAAVEDGWPDAPKTAVVARGGALGRIALESGQLLAVNENAYPEREATCHAVRLGPSFGFVCGEREGPTSIYAFAPPLAVRKVMSFKNPRFVAPSGNGALVVRGPCQDGPVSEGDTRVYCIRAADGGTREVRVKGDLGVERVIALSDGRVAVLVPPRGGSAGQLTLLAGADMKSVGLLLPTKPRSVARELRRGMWLEGFEEREPGVLSGWVEAGGPVVGVRVTLDGKVTAGDLRDNESGVIVSGRFALSQGDGGRAAESTDGGMTWKVFDLPEHDPEPDDARARGCGPVGCALGGWIRVGWGKPATTGDLAPAEAPQPLYVPMKSSPTVHLQCEPTGAPVTPPLPDKPAAARKEPAVPPFATHPLPPGPFGPPRMPMTGPTSPWMPFRNTAPPKLEADEVGIDNGAPYDLVGVRGYAWGKRGSDWARTGHFLVRFDDRFDPGGGVRSSAPSAPPWSDEALTADAMGVGSYPMASWGAYLDPSGRSALVPICKGPSCSLFAVGEGQPALLLRDTSGRTNGFTRPVPHGAVRLGESWFFLTPGASYDTVTLFRVDLGVARALGTFYRPSPSRYLLPDPPRLLRRALGTGLGILVTAIPDPGERSGGLYVYPVDPDTGTIGEPIGLGRKDLGGALPPRCADGQDGWMIDTGLETTPAVEIVGARASLDSIELRLRLDPGTACVEGVAARVDGTVTPDKDAAASPGKAPKEKPAEGTLVPLAATERATGKRWVLRCGKRGTFR